MGETAEEFKVFAKTGIRWLLKNSRLCHFATDTMLRVMAEAEVLVTDGTFSIRPKGAADNGQILTIHALVNTDTGEEWVPVLMGSIVVS
uniref:Uncharacterized protein n=1 Tax=Panagrolaimus superbus TaxID=310955 RepID=A0A914Y678_9BILA